MDPEELLNDEAFKEQLANAKNYDEVIELFSSKGIEVTEEMLKAAEVSEGEGELDESALEGVAGGRYGMGGYIYILGKRVRIELFVRLR